MKAATAPPTCHVMRLIVRDHHVIQVSTCESHMSQRGSTPAIWVVTPPTPSRACTCLIVPWELPAGDEHKVTVGHTGETQLETHL